MTKLLYYQKILLSLVCLITITVIVIEMHMEDTLKYIVSMQNNTFEKLIGMFNGIKPEEDDVEYDAYMREGFVEGLGFLDGAKKFFSGGYNKEIKDGIEDKIVDPLKGPLEEITNFFKKIKDFMESIPKRFEALGFAFKDVGDGIKMEFENLGKSLKVGAIDIFDVVEEAGKCTINFFTNFRTCILWYILDWIGSTIYSIFVKLPVTIIHLITGIDAQSYVDDVRYLLEEVDKKCVEWTCHHCFHFPDWVIEKCYSCKLKSIETINYDFGRGKGTSYNNECGEPKMDNTRNSKNESGTYKHNTIPGLLNQPDYKFKNAGHHFNQAVMFNMKDYKKREDDLTDYDDDVQEPIPEQHFENPCSNYRLKRLEGIFTA
jgi:hypothetical protein